MVIPRDDSLVACALKHTQLCAGTSTLACIASKFSRLMRERYEGSREASVIRWQLV